MKAWLVLAAVLLAGCGFASHRSYPSNPNGDQPRLASDPSADARQNLQNAFKKLHSAYPYRLTDVIEVARDQSGTKSMTRVVDYAGADRIHTRIGSYESIEFEGKNYGYYDGKWVETGPHAKLAAAEIENILAKSLKETQMMGSETVNGVACVLYAIRFEYDAKGMTTIGSAKIWIGLADGLPQQMDSETKIVNSTSKSHIIYQYNLDIKVEKPIP